MAQAMILGAIGASFLYSLYNQESKPNMGSVKSSGKQGNGDNVSAVIGDDESEKFAEVADIKTRTPFQSCVEKEGAWLSSNLLPKQTANVDDNWAVYTPNDVKDKNFLSAGHHYGIDTVGSSLKNANTQLRSEPIIPKKDISPFLNSSIDADNNRRRFDIQDY